VTGYQKKSQYNAKLQLVAQINLKNKKYKVMFIMFYVYRPTTTLLCMQHVRGFQALCCIINLTSLDLKVTEQKKHKINRNRQMEEQTDRRVNGTFTAMYRWVNAAYRKTREKNVTLDQSIFRYQRFR